MNRTIVLQTRYSQIREVPIGTFDYDHYGQPAIWYGYGNPLNASTQAGCGVGHTLIRPHTPTDNGLIERYHRTIGERIEDCDLENFTSAKAVIAGIIEHYNQVRLHSSLNFLRPVDYYRGDPETLLAQRRRKLQEARELRKQENLKLRQRLFPWTPEEHSYSRKQVVSL